eukprot:jgi/Tetstr1/426715/TSEL_001652.t1
MEQALRLRQRLASLLDALGMQRNPSKSFWGLFQFSMHMEVDIDSASGMFYSPAGMLDRFSRQAIRLIGHGTRTARWVPLHELQSLLRRDLQWWTSVPGQSNGKPIHRPVETDCLHTDSYGYRADRLSRDLDSDYWQLDLLKFSELESRFGPHSIDPFASALNTLLPRYNVAWLDPTCEAVDSLHLPDMARRQESNLCNAPLSMLPDLVQERQRSGAAATVVATRWEAKAWHHVLTEMAVEELTVAPRPGLFRPGRRDDRASEV